MQFIDLSAQQLIIRKNIERRIKDVLDGGKYILGPEIYELEKDFKLDYFDYHIFFTERVAADLPKNMLYVSKDIYQDRLTIDLVSHSKNKSSSGYPDWANELTKIKNKINNQKITLFYSGPKYIRKDLEVACKLKEIDFNSDG